MGESGKPHDDAVAIVKVNGSRMVETTFRVFDSKPVVVVHLRLGALKNSYELGAAAVGHINMARQTDHAHLIDSPFDFPTCDNQVLNRAVGLYSKKMDNDFRPFIKYVSLPSNIV